MDIPMGKGTYKRLRVIAIGRGVYLYKTIERLAREHEVIAICVSTPPQDDELGYNDFKELANKIKCDIYYEVIPIERIKQLKPDIGITINYKKLIKKELFSIPKYGIFNAHAGNLPRYQGNATPNWAILNGEKYIDLNIIKIDESLDDGEIWARKRIRLNNNTTIAELKGEIELECQALFSILLMNIDDVKPMKKANFKPMRCYPRQPIDSKIDWHNSAKNILRLVNASGIPYAAYCFLGGERLEIYKAHIQPPPFDVCGITGQIVSWGENIGVLCGDNQILVIDEASWQMPGSAKNRMLIL